jgi:hypothetical protein
VNNGQPRLLRSIKIPRSAASTAVRHTPSKLAMRVRFPSPAPRFVSSPWSFDQPFDLLLSFGVYWPLVASIPVFSLLRYDESYVDEPIWNRIWARAVAESGILFEPTAYQVRHAHASWLIDAGENPKAVMHRLGQADLRTTARYVHVLDETGESAARRFEGLLPPL